MNAVHAPTHFSPISPVDRQNGPDSALHAARSTPKAEAPLPRADASEPADLVPVAVRGYN